MLSYPFKIDIHVISVPMSLFYSYHNLFRERAEYIYIFVGLQFFFLNT